MCEASRQKAAQKYTQYKNTTLHRTPYKNSRRIRMEVLLESHSTARTTMLACDTTQAGVYSDKVGK